VTLREKALSRRRRRPNSTVFRSALRAGERDSIWLGTPAVRYKPPEGENLAPTRA